MEDLTLLSVQSLKNREQELTVLDQFVGYAHKMPSSVNLFLNVSDLLDTTNNRVKFMTISLPGAGSKEHVLSWGVYEKDSDKFIIDNGCNYESYDRMNEIISNWKQQGYQSAMATKENKISDTLNQYTTNVSFINSMFGGTPLIPDDKTYRAVLYFIAFTRGKITEEELLIGAPNFRNYINNLSLLLQRKKLDNLDDFELLNFVDDLETYKKKYEEGLNVVSVVNTIKKVLGPYLSKITNSFRDTYSKSKFYYESNLDSCPTFEFCQDNAQDILCAYVNYITEEELLS